MTNNQETLVILAPNEIQKEKEVGGWGRIIREKV